eukprot:scaffold111499_cov95-Phaeocystis_antarctica.AAC.1
MARALCRARAARTPSHSRPSGTRCALPREAAARQCRLQRLQGTWATAVCAQRMVHAVILSGLWAVGYCAFLQYDYQMNRHHGACWKVVGRAG